jgi:glycosyltransferase involved in cell wall biosynthesis
VNIHREIAASGAGAVVPTQFEPLAAEISRWLGDSALRAQAASLGPTFVKAQYDWNQIARRWADHYARLVAAQKRH